MAREDGIYSCEHFPIFPGSCIQCAGYDIGNDPVNTAIELASLRHMWERISCYFSGDVWDYYNKHPEGICFGGDGIKGISHLQDTYRKLEDGRVDTGETSPEGL